MQQLFLDCDGVLADFDQGFDDLFGHRPDRNNPQMSARQMWRIIREASGFYKHLPMMDDAMALYDAVKHLRPIILTGIPLGTWAVPQKLAWRDRHFPGVPMVTCLAANKVDYCQPGDVLVDDTVKHMDAWTIGGGTFVIHTSAADSISQLKKLDIIG